MQLNGGASGSGLHSEINVTPLVDVVLVLLIIFMVVAPGMMKPGPEVDLPKTGTPPEQEPYGRRGGDQLLTARRLARAASPCGWHTRPAPVGC